MSVQGIFRCVLTVSNFTYISTPSNARHRSEAPAVSLHTISLSSQWDLSLPSDSLSLSLKHTQHQSVIMDFWTTTIGSLFCQIRLTNHQLIYLFWQESWMWEMNSGRVRVPLPQRLFPRLICFPAVCELIAAARAGSCIKLLLSEKFVFKERCCSDYCLPVLFLLFHSFFLHPSFLSPLPQCFASSPLSLSLPFFCPPDNVKMTGKEGQ